MQSGAVQQAFSRAAGTEQGGLGMGGRGAFKSAFVPADSTSPAGPLQAPLWQPLCACTHQAMKFGAYVPAVSP